MVQSPMIGWNAGESHSVIFRPPLVSLVLINWNYAAYVGAAIDSIASQDYPLLEAIIVDNGSTDASRDVIAKHVGEDERFPNRSPRDKISASLAPISMIFKLIRGEFVTIVDADDVLFANFVSSHVQVHLALPCSVAFTSSNVVEMTADCRALTGSFGSFGDQGKVMTRGLRPVDSALRLPTISDEDYRQLALCNFHLCPGAWMDLGARDFEHVPASHPGAHPSPAEGPDLFPCRR